MGVKQSAQRLAPGERAARGSSGHGGSGILVTGGAGFIGSHLVRRLVQEGHRPVRVLDNLSRGSGANLASIRECIEFVRADIRNRVAVAKAVRNTNLVFHLAAQSNVIGAVADVDYSRSTNVVGTAALLEAARAAGVRRFVFTSSREVYGDPHLLPVPETAPLAPKNAYGMSKVAGEMCCAMSAAKQFQPVILRLANVYGTGDRGRVIPLFIERALRGLPLVVYGGAQVLDFIHVSHVVDGLIRAGFGKRVPCPVNVGSGRGTTIRELARRILQLTNSNSRVSRRPGREVEVVRFVADTARARSLLSLEQGEDPFFGLQEVIDWIAGETSPARAAACRGAA